MKKNVKIFFRHSFGGWKPIRKEKRRLKIGGRNYDKNMKRRLEVVDSYYQPNKYIVVMYV